MATKKRTSAKKSSGKKSSGKSKAKTAAKSGKVTLGFTLDDEKIAAIQRCLAKGTLNVTVSRTALTSGRVKDPWLYD
jgi:hypothetical protein